jgi:hypothetical protein
VVRGLAQVAFRPGWWGAGLAVAGFVAGPWWLALTGVMPYGLYRWSSRSRVVRILTILLAVSSRVKSLHLARQLRRQWRPLMTRLGLSRQTVHRGEHVTVVPALGRPRLDDYGLSVAVNLQRLDQPPRALAKLAENIEASLGVPACSVHKTGPGRARMTLRHTDPLADPVAIDRLPPPTRRLHVVTRLAEDGRGVEQGYLLPDLTVGAVGAGKSMAARVKLYRLYQMGVPVRVRLFDPKGQEFADLADAAYDYESNAAAWPAFLGRAYGGLQARQRHLATRKVRELLWFDDTNPLDVMVVDELMSVVAAGNGTVRVGGAAMKASAVFMLYASQGRAAGYTVEALSQLAQKETIGAVRDVFATVTCLRVPPQAREMVNLLLGEGAATYYPAHEIPAGRWTAGIGYTRRTDGTVVRTRGAGLDDAQQWQLAAWMREATERFRVRTGRREKAGAAA